jgi:hypothetical protein
MIVMHIAICASNAPNALAQRRYSVRRLLEKYGP